MLSALIFPLLRLLATLFFYFINVKFNIECNLPNKNTKGPILFLVSHNLYLFDWIIFIYKLNIFKYPLSIVAGGQNHKYLNFFIFPINLIHISYKNTVKRVLDRINLGSDLVIFAEQNKIENNTGIYNIIKHTDCKIVTVKSTAKT